jgi:CO/xanthine dehydrogenase Mo-binding subunit
MPWQHCPEIQVKLEESPALYDPEIAMQPDAPLINPEHGTNICNYHCVRTGNLESGERKQIWLSNKASVLPELNMPIWNQNAALPI